MRAIPQLVSAPLLFTYFIIYFQNDRTDHPASRASFCLLDGEGGKEAQISLGFWKLSTYSSPKPSFCPK